MEIVLCYVWFYVDDLEDVIGVMVMMVLESDIGVGNIVG